MSRASARIIGGNSVLDNEARDQRRIAARRARDESRRIKFLTAKTRLMGQNIDAIEQQKADKRARQEAERVADEAFVREQQMIREENRRREEITSIFYNFRLKNQLFHIKILFCTNKKQVS